MKASKTIVPRTADSANTNGTVSQQARTIVTYHGERILAEIPRTLRLAGTLFLVLAITIPVFCVAMLVVLWHLGH
jgi:hypothetical protein